MIRKRQPDLSVCKTEDYPPVSALDGRSLTPRRKRHIIGPLSLIGHKVQRDTR